MSLVLFYTAYISCGWILQTSNGKSLRPSCHQIAFVPIGAVVLGAIGAPYGTAFYGFFALERAGRICQNDTVRTKRCIGDSRTGSVPKYWNKCYWRWPRISRTVVA